MTRSIEIRPLEKSDDRSGFSCGEAALDRFFRHYAGQNQFRLGLAVTYVAVTNGRVLGFATVTVGAIETRALPDAKLRRRLPAYPLPILRLARLGVNVGAQGSGLGGQLLRFTLGLALRQRASLGCLGVVTDAKPDAVAFYRRLGFIPLDTVREGRVHGGSTPLFLDIRAIAAAAAGSR